MFLSVLLAPMVSTAMSFSIDSVKDIECVDAAPTAEMNVRFTTSSDAAHKYTRRPGMIPYDYSNTVVPMGVFATGTLTVANNPDTEAGKIVLAEKTEYSVCELVLKPTQQSGTYYGYLTGEVEDLSRDWVKITSRHLICTVYFKRLQ